MSVEDEKAQGSPQLDVESMSFTDSDDAMLEMLGYKPEFKRDFSFLGLWSLCSSELAVLPGVAGTIWCVYNMLKFTHAHHLQVHYGLLVSFHQRHEEGLH